MSQGPQKEPDWVTAIEEGIASFVAYWIVAFGWAFLFLGWFMSTILLGINWYNPPTEPRTPEEWWWLFGAVSVFLPTTCFLVRGFCCLYLKTDHILDKLKEIEARLTAQDDQLKKLDD